MGRLFDEMGLDWSSYMSQVSGSTSTDYETLQAAYKKSAEDRVLSLVNGNEVTTRTYDEVKSAGKGGK